MEDKIFKLYVSCLPSSYTESDLVPVFEPYGSVVDLAIIRDRFTGQSKGSAFVTFATADAASLAIQTLNGSIRLPGCTRPIQVRMALRQGAEEDDSQPLQTKVFVGLIPKAMEDSELLELFAPYGDVLEHVILR
ncbi:hypothetical protein KIPB_009143 [Kipferlia bialata]|uniref:RRM domain-containing protein n=1 Tax=Kipferlia bialata TaxID=797122 RepID=A0A9K3D3I3_9EUKA|nr:hypothetical protein KIPB_009143 [Kipferlia bialata]|eukprot:g9143.t1